MDENGKKSFNMFRNILNELHVGKIEIIPNNTNDCKLADMLTKLLNKTFEREKNG